MAKVHWDSSLSAQNSKKDYDDSLASSFFTVWRFFFCRIMLVAEGLQCLPRCKQSSGQVFLGYNKIPSCTLPPVRIKYIGVRLQNYHQVWKQLGVHPLLASLLLYSTSLVYLGFLQRQNSTATVGRYIEINATQKSIQRIIQDFHFLVLFKDISGPQAKQQMATSDRPECIKKIK